MYGYMGFYITKWKMDLKKHLLRLEIHNTSREASLESPPAGGWAWKFPGEQVWDRQRASWGGVGRERSGGRRGVNGPK